MCAMRLRRSVSSMGLGRAATALDGRYRTRRIKAGQCLIAVVSIATAQMVTAQAQCIPGTSQNFGPTGSLQTYNVPVGANAVYIEANGAAGGSSGEVDPAFAPGTGAHIAAITPLSGVATLNVVVGQRGQFGLNRGAGGGGGSFVYTPTDALLVAAGGGGGAGTSDAGQDAQLGQNGGSADPPYGGAGGTAGNGGAGGSINMAGGGGGGFLSAGLDGPPAQSGLGGHRISSPGDAAGGLVGGGYGGGGGGGGIGGGGGGGYSGGGGGYGEGRDGGGGGGSFVAANGTTLAAAIIDGPADGSVTICATDARPVPTLSQWGVAALALMLSLFGVRQLSRRG